MSAFLLAVTSATASSLVGVADVVMLVGPDHQGRSGFAAMRTVSKCRLAWGSAAGALLIPVSAFGAWPIFVCLGSGGVTATVCAVSVALFLCVGATAHVAFAHIGLVEQGLAASERTAERHALADIARWQRRINRPQIVIAAVLATAAVLAFSVSVWQNETCYPRWMSVANPALLAATAFVAPLLWRNGMTRALQAALVHCALAPLLFLTAAYLYHAR
jgi:hypothetical protein